MTNIRKGLGKSFDEIFGEGTNNNYANQQSINENFVKSNIICDKKYNELSSTYYIMRLIDNIEYFSNMLDLGIVEIENEIGVSQGYISRIKKKEVQKISVDVLIKLSNLFNVTIDYLITYDKDKVSPIENTIILFLDKLYQETEKLIISWEKYIDINDKTNTYINEGKYDELPISNYSNTVKYLRSVKRCISNTDFETSIVGNSYTTKLVNENSEVALISMRYYPIGHIKDDANEHYDHIELYIINDSLANYICSTYDTSEIVSKKINNLYQTISATISNIKLNKLTKSIINDYLEYKR